MRELPPNVSKFIEKLKKRDAIDSAKMALDTLNLLRGVVSSNKLQWNTAGQLIDIVRDVGILMIRANPIAYVVGNMVRRVLHIIREEYRLLLYSEGILTSSGGIGVGGLGNESGSASPMPLSATTSNRHHHQHFLSTYSNPPSALSEASNPAVNNSNSSNSVSNSLRLSGLTHSASNSNSSISLATTITNNSSTNNCSSHSSNMYNLLADAESPAIDYHQYTFPDLRVNVIQAIGEFIDETEGIMSNLILSSHDHIHTDEIIMTIGNSTTISEFILAAAARRSFSVIVAETAPYLSGHYLAQKLSSSPHAGTNNSISVTLIPDAAIYAMMARVNKVVLGCNVVTANGGILALPGTYALTLAAKHYSIPVVVVTGMHKLTPVYPQDQDAHNLYQSPGWILPHGCAEQVFEGVNVENPSLDYIPPSLISLLITNLGDHAPSYIYRLLDEVFDREDYNL